MDRGQMAEHRMRPATRHGVSPSGRGCAQDQLTWGAADRYQPCEHSPRPRPRDGLAACSRVARWIAGQPDTSGRDRPPASTGSGTPAVPAHARPRTIPFTVVAARSAGSRPPAPRVTARRTDPGCAEAEDRRPVTRWPDSTVARCAHEADFGHAYLRDRAGHGFRDWTARCSRVHGRGLVPRGGGSVGSAR